MTPLVPALGWTLIHFLWQGALAALLTEVLFFFHPAVWWLSREIRQEREQASDDLAVRLCGDALEYAQALTTLEALASGSPSSRTAPRLALGAQGGSFMIRIQRLISPTAPTQLAPRAGLAVLLLLGGVFALQAHAQQAGRTTIDPASPLAKGTVRLRRYDLDSPDGKTRAGTLDMRVESAPLATMERAWVLLQKIPANTTRGYEDLEVKADPSEKGGLWQYKFTGAEAAVVMGIIRGQAGLGPIEKKPGLLVIQRINSFTHQGGLLPRGLFVEVWAGDVPADQVLQALNDLEAMTPKAGSPQEVRREIAPGTGQGPRITLDLRSTDPLQVRDQLEKALGKKDN